MLAPFVPAFARRAYAATLARAREAATTEAAAKAEAAAMAAIAANARQTLADRRRLLEAERDAAVAKGDIAGAERITQDLDDIDNLKRHFADPLPPAAAKEKAKAEPASSEPNAAEPAPGHDPGALMPGSADANTAEDLKGPPGEPKITAYDRVRPTEKTPLHEYSLNDAGQQPGALDHSRLLRGNLVGFRNLGQHGPDGKFLASDAEVETHLAKQREHIKPEYFHEYEEIVRKMRAGEINYLAAERLLTEKFVHIPTWEKIGELILDLTPFVSQFKSILELNNTLKDFHLALELGDDELAEELAITAAAQAAGLLPLGKALGAAAGKVANTRAVVAAYLAERAGTRQRWPVKSTLEPYNKSAPASYYRAKSRPIVRQDSDYDCVPASIAMVLNAFSSEKRRSADIAKPLRAQGILDKSGMKIADAERVLKNLGHKDAEFVTKTTIDEIAKRTSGGHPAIVAIRLYPNGLHALHVNHAVIVDGVTTVLDKKMQKEIRVVAVRDPANSRPSFVPADYFEELMNRRTTPGAAIFSNPKR